MAESQGCDEKKGSEYIAAGDYDRAFASLKSCENSSASGLALGQLAALYGELEYGDFNSDSSRAQKVYDLYRASAIKGNEDAVLSLISILENGEPLISLERQEEKSSCLQKLVDSEEYTSCQIKSCLNPQ